MASYKVLSRPRRDGRPSATACIAMSCCTCSACVCICAGVGILSLLVVSISVIGTFCVSTPPKLSYCSNFSIASSASEGTGIPSVCIFLPCSARDRSSSSSLAGRSSTKLIPGNTRPDTPLSI